MELSGRILDKYTRRPIPFASITIIAPGGVYTGIGTQANVQGQFYLNDPEADFPNYMRISAAEYYPMQAQLYEDFFIGQSSDFLLTRKVKNLDEVILTSTK